MLSDELKSKTLAALAKPAERYRSGVAEALEQLHGWLGRHRDGGPHIHEMAVELGRFAEGRLDVARFSSLFAGHGLADTRGVATVERAVEVLTELLAAGPKLGYVRVPRGGDMHAAVANAMARIGRAFGAAAVAQEAKRRIAVAPDDPRLTRYPYDRWNAAERRMAMPLVVDVAGADCRPASLAEFLDGGQKILLLIEGECSPAPLARLVSPGTLVVQAPDAAAMAVLGGYDGPAIGAVVPESSATFVHDPRHTDRLSLGKVPAEVPPGVRSGLSQRQQLDELALLVSLAGAGLPKVAVQGERRGPTGSPVDTLASWLLSQSGFDPAAAR